MNNQSDSQYLSDFSETNSETSTSSATSTTSGDSIISNKSKTNERNRTSVTSQDKTTRNLNEADQVSSTSSASNVDQASTARCARKSSCINFSNKDIEINSVKVTRSITEVSGPSNQTENVNVNMTVLSVKLRKNPNYIYTLTKFSKEPSASDATKSSNNSDGEVKTLEVGPSEKSNATDIILKTIEQIENNESSQSSTVSNNLKGKKNQTGAAKKVTDSNNAVQISDTTNKNESTPPANVNNIDKKGKKKKKKKKNQNAPKDAVKSNNANKTNDNTNKSEHVQSDVSNSSETNKRKKNETIATEKISKPSSEEANVRESAEPGTITSDGQDKKKKKKKKKKNKINDAKKTNDVDVAYKSSGEPNVSDPTQPSTSSNGGAVNRNTGAIPKASKKSSIEELNLNKSASVLIDSLDKARSYYEQKNYGRSFAHYLVVFQLLTTEERKLYENEFVNTLLIWGTTLHERAKYNDVFRCYKMALRYFPNNPEILTNAGIHSLKIRQFEKAKTFLDKALCSAPHFLPAEQHLLSTIYALVERWHFPMLNDIIRNKAYAQAIFTAINKGFTNILDVGTGTGLLSLFASRSQQCKSITACDYSDIMFEIAKNVLQANKVTNVKLIQKISFNLTIPGDLQKPVNLLITEILDCGVFGENILGALIHAWENLLVPHPYGRVIPEAVVLYVVGIQSKEIARKSRLLKRINDILLLNSLKVHHKPEFYDSENLNMIDFCYMTDINQGLVVNFNNIAQLKTLVTSHEFNPVINLTCTNSGTIDAYAVWFQLQLGKHIHLSSEPSVDSCWDQAIIKLTSPLYVTANEKISVKMSCVDGILELLGDNLDTTEDMYSVSKKILTFLNDELYMNLLEKAADKIVKHFKNKPDISVLDINVFPILGLLLMKKANANMICKSKSQMMEDLILHICKINHIDTKKLRIIDKKIFCNFLNENTDKYDVIYQNTLCYDGIPDDNEVYQTEMLQEILKPGGILLPKHVTIYAQLVQCDWLSKATRVSDENLCGFKIAQFINKYKSADQREIIIDKLDYIALSNAIKIEKIALDTSAAYVSPKRLKMVDSGFANAILYWYKVKIMEGLSMTTRREDCYVYNAAFMLEHPKNVKEGQTLVLKLIQQGGMIKMVIKRKL